MTGLRLHFAPHAPFTEPTTDYWQTILPAEDPAGHAVPPYRYCYPARLPDRRILLLPIRPVPDGTRAAASLIANHAAFHVVDTLASFMAGRVRDIDADVVVGLPTLGLTFAPQVARRIGYGNYVPLGYSRKFWYRDALSEPVSSFTTPGEGKLLFIDPYLLPRIEGRRAIVVDDAVSSGRTLVAALNLLERLGCRPVAALVAMIQGDAWQEPLEARRTALPGGVRGVFVSPLLRPAPDGWVPLEAGRAK